MSSILQKNCTTEMAGYCIPNCYSESKESLNPEESLILKKSVAISYSQYNKNTLMV